MKRISLLLVVLLMILPGCQRESQYEDLELLLETAPEGEYESPTKSYLDWSCSYYEDNIYRATDIIKGKYVTTKQLYPNYIHIFEVTDIVRGIETENIIYVRGKAEGLDGHSTHEIDYTKDKEYLLLLVRTAGTYTPYDVLRSVHDSLIIPLNDRGEPDIANSRFCCFDLSTGIQDAGIKNAINSGNFLEYILEAIKYNPSIYNEENRKVPDMMESIQKADIVIKAVIWSEGIIEEYDRQYYTVRIENTLKGDFEIARLVTIELPTRLKAKVGDTFILAGTTSNGVGFSILNQYSVFDISYENEITSLIG